MKRTTLILLALSFCLIVKAQTADSVTSKFNKISYIRVDIFAKFPEGGFDEYVIKHIRFPLGQAQNVKGEIVIAYTIDTAGNVVNARLLKNLTPAIDEEILRVMNTAPKWKPAKFKGNNVQVNVGMRLIVTLDAGAKTIIATKPELGIGGGKSENSIYTAVQVPPIYPGGQSALVKYLDKNIIYPENALKNKVEGKVIVSFVVEKDGVLSNFKCLKSPSDDFYSECVRVLKECKFSSGSQNGRPVRVQWSMLINFNSESPQNHAE